ncbi:MAG: HTH domain-containing protein [Bacteroidota bacterium]
MQLQSKIGTLYRLHQLIRHRMTGNSRQLAEQLHVSKSTLFRYLNELKSLGAPIAFCNQGRHYYYESDFELRLSKLASFSPLDYQE